MCCECAGDSPEPEQQQQFELASISVRVFGGAAWALAIYARPVVSLVRSPFGQRINMAHAIAYVVLLLLVGRIWAAMLQLESTDMVPDGLILPWLKGFAAPLFW